MLSSQMRPVVMLISQLAAASAFREALHDLIKDGTAEAQNRTAAAGKASCGVRIFTDVDDTTACSNGKFLHGIDHNCEEKGVLYPGMPAFYWSLSSGAGGCLDPPRVVPLSARPQELGRLVAIKDTDPLNVVLAEVGAQHGNGAWGIDIERAVYGTVTVAKEVADMNFENSLSPAKFQGWRDWKSDFPTIFVGDNGQGDAFAAEMMAEHSQKEGQPVLVAAFIHHVQWWRSPTNPKTKTSMKSHRPGDRHTLGQKGIVLFQNYGEAACYAHGLGLLPPGGYEFVMNSIMQTCGDFDTMACLVTEPEFGLAISPEGEEVLFVRPPQFCGAGRAPLGNAFDQLATELTRVAGRSSLGSCGDLHVDILAILVELNVVMERLPEPPVQPGTQFDMGEWLAQTYGINLLVYHAWRGGIHCLTQCDYTCKQEYKGWEWKAQWELRGTSLLVDRHCGENLVQNVLRKMSPATLGGRKLCHIVHKG